MKKPTPKFNDVFEAAVKELYGISAQEYLTLFDECTSLEEFKERLNQRQDKNRTGRLH
jgi:hypothetical protein